MRFSILSRSLACATAILICSHSLAQSIFEQNDVGTEIRNRLQANGVTGWTLVPNIGDTQLRLFTYTTNTQKRWMVVARLSNHPMSAKMQQNGVRTPVSQQATQCAAAINAGYFNMNTGKSTSIVVENYQLTGRDEQNISRPNGKAHPTRAVLGRSQLLWEMRWARTIGNEVHSYEAPANPWNSPQSGSVWTLENAVGAGPMLIQNGASNITAEAELFDAKSGVDPNGLHGRTAVGLDNTGLVFFLVADGRRTIAQGASMTGLAGNLLSFGATNAMNLDGGGSSTLVINGQVINQPSDGSERPVVSILCLE